MPQGQKTWPKKKAKGNKKRNNKYLPTTLHLSIFPLRKKTNHSKKHPFFVTTQKNQSPFFCNIFKEKKASFRKSLPFHP